ncbi:MAG: enoyl-CoA hydratase [Mobilicoccus sp.]|nr:enoyl-CoA hydratase [Mobilicoccus sp.]
MTSQNLLAVSDGEVLSSLDGGVLTLTMNKPSSLNALSAENFATIESIVRAGSVSDDVRVIVIRGEGKGFCSGADLDPTGPPSSATLDTGAAAIVAIRNSPKPVVSVVQGPCAGIGVSLALAADLVVASDKAFFLLAFTNIALMPDGGATALVAASIGRARAMRMSLLAERVPGEQAYDWGLVSHLSTADELEDDVQKLVTTVASGPSRAYEETKKAVNDATLGELNEAFSRERYGQTALMTTDDFREGVQAFLDRRKATFTGR